jgi:excisionase family DNA binding protein
MLGISRAQAYQLVRGGELPSIKLGRRVVVPRAALLRLVSGEPGKGAGTPDR